MKARSICVYIWYLDGIAAEDSSAAHVDRAALAHAQDAAVGWLRLPKKEQNRPIDKKKQKKNKKKQTPKTRSSYLHYITCQRLVG